MFDHDDISKVLNLGEGSVVLCGAGISIAPPTRLNGADGFYQKLGNALLTGSSQTAECISTGLKGNETHPALRFEQLITILMDVDPGLSCLDFLLAENLVSPHPVPNKLHDWLARGLENGCSVITTNFDVMIEIALYHLDPKRYDEHVCRLTKVHGSIQSIENGCLAEDDRATLKADIRSVAMGTSVDFVPSAVEYLLPQFGDKHLVIAGYSFSDSFDIIPLLARSRPQNVTIIEYAPTELATASTFETFRDFDIVNRSWLENGVPVTKLRGDLVKALADKASIVSSPRSAPTITTMFPVFSPEQADYIVARLDMDRGLFTAASTFESVAERAQGAGNLLLAEQAAFYAAWSLPEWDQTLAMMSREVV